MKKIISVLVILVLSLLSAVIKPSKAMEYPPISESSVGIQKINGNEVCCTGRFPEVIYMEALLKIPANTIYCLYASASFAGCFENLQYIEYELWNEKGLEESCRCDWYRGGWYAHSFVENNTNKEKYFIITNFGNQGYIEFDDFIETLELEEVKSKSDLNFTGIHPFIPESMGYKLVDEDLTYVTTTDNELTDESILDLFFTMDTWYINTATLSIAESNYRNEAGSYKCVLCSEDLSHNKRYVNLDIEVLDAKKPEINGPDDIFWTIHESVDKTIDDVLSLYSGSYYTQEYKLSVKDDKIQIFDFMLGYPGVVTVDIDCEFAGGMKITRKITIHIIDDVLPDVFVKQCVFETSEYKTKTLAEITAYLDTYLLSTTGKKASNIIITYNDYAGNENKPGTYNVLYNYDIDGKTYESLLKIKVDDQDKDSESSFNVLYVIIPSVSMIALCGIVFIIRKRKIA